MTLQERIDSFVNLGNTFAEVLSESRNPSLDPFRSAMMRAELENPWFTQDNIRYSLNEWSQNLTREKLQTWMRNYADAELDHVFPSAIAVIMAGNIPLVGFHDLLCVLLSGNRLVAKLSSKDSALMQAITEILIGQDPQWKQFITLTKSVLPSFDGIIATGSNNSSRYFEYYFSAYPHIIRKNRNSVAVLDGREDENVLRALAGDILLYFGMGCRSVSKVYLPRDYDLSKFTAIFGKFDSYAYHNKYLNNLNYFRSVYLMNSKPVFDIGIMLLVEDASLSSPISVLNFERYDDLQKILGDLDMQHDRLQCKVGIIPSVMDWVMPGMTQKPRLEDYADGVDTFRFLLNIPKK
jgi:hypothetical protein